MVEEYASKLKEIADGRKTAKDFIADEVKEETSTVGELLRLFRELLERMERSHREEGGEGEEGRPLTEV